MNVNVFLFVSFDNNPSHLNFGKKVANMFSIENKPVNEIYFQVDNTIIFESNYNFDDILEFIHKYREQSLNFALFDFKYGHSSMYIDSIKICSIPNLSNLLNKHNIISSDDDDFPIEKTSNINNEKLTNEVSYIEVNPIKCIENEPNIQEKLDLILNKISSSGLSSLNENELGFLKTNENLI